LLWPVSRFYTLSQICVLNLSAVASAEIAQWLKTSPKAILAATEQPRGQSNLVPSEQKASQAAGSRRDQRTGAQRSVGRNIIRKKIS
jgi:hypothetical protein